MKTVAEMTHKELVAELRTYGVTGRGLVVMSVKALRLSVAHCRAKRREKAA